MSEYFQCEYAWLNSDTFCLSNNVTVRYKRMVSMDGWTAYKKHGTLRDEWSRDR